jgi:hypothetical protein
MYLLEYQDVKASVKWWLEIPVNQTIKTYEPGSGPELVRVVSTIQRHLTQSAQRLRDLAGQNGPGARPEPTDKERRLLVLFGRQLFVDVADMLAEFRQELQNELDILDETDIWDVNRCRDNIDSVIEELYEFGDLYGIWMGV